LVQWPPRLADNKKVRVSRSPSPAVGVAVLIAIVAMVAVGKPILNDGLDPDMFWHLRVAQQVWHDATLGQIGPVVDTMSYNASHEPWTPYSWLAELMMLGVWNAGGFRLTVFVDAAVSGLTVVFVALSAMEACRYRHRYDRRRNPDGSRAKTSFGLSSAIVACCASVLLLPMQSFRPVTLVLMLMAMAAWLLWRDRRMRGKSHAVWIVPVLVLLVANMHLYVALMVMLVAATLHWSRRFQRRSLRVVIACAVASVCTPMLPGVISSSFNYASGDPMVAAGLIAEMKSMLGGPAGFVQAIVIAMLIGLVAWHHRTVGKLPIIAAAFCFALALWLGRFQTVLAIALAPLVAMSMPVLRDVVLSRPPVRVALACLLGLMLLRLATAFPQQGLSMGDWANRHDLTSDIAPGGVPELAARFVESTVTPTNARIITEFTDGGFVGWRLPQFAVFMDGRTNVHPPEFWRNVYLSDQASVERVLGFHPADAAILPSEHSRLRASLERTGWRVAFSEPRAVVLLPPELPKQESEQESATID